VRQGAGGVADLLDHAGRAVAGDIGVHERRALGEGSLDRGDDGQGFPRHVDDGHRVLGDVAVAGHHERDGLADEAYLVGGEGSRGSRMGEMGVGDEQRRRLVHLTEVGGGQDQIHAGQRARPRGVDRDDARVGVGTPEHRAVEPVGGVHVVHEAAVAAEEPRVLVPGDPGADRAGGHRRSIRSAARRTARTMFW